MDGYETNRVPPTERRERNESLACIIKVIRPSKFS